MPVVAIVFFLRALRAWRNRIQGDCAELVDVMSDAWSADRDAERCRRDGYENISFELLAAGKATVVSTAGEQARALLMSPAYIAISIGEIAFRSGFVDHRTFNRMFKRRHGMTPQDVRQGR